MSSPTPPDNDELPSFGQFLQTIRRSGLLEEKPLRAWLATLPPEFQQDPRYVAEALVRAGKLSRFQASMILKGMARGLILGPYQILAQIGKGGMGTVYLARDSRTQALVALKILSPRKAREEERMIARFQREMELSRKVDHPNLCKTFESGILNHVLYLAMEFIPGKTLTRVVQDEGTLPVPRLARLMAGVATGLIHAHERGLIHRDLKPGNIMITPHDQAKVLDLGLAFVEGEVVEDIQVVGGSGYIVGTMDYIAPEQTYDPTAVDGRADLYSLGCTIYYALTGRTPFPGGTNKEKIQRHRSEEPPPLLDLRPDLPRGFVALVRRLMAKNPETRTASAKEAEEQLLRWANDQSQPTEHDLELDVDAAIAELRVKEASSEFSWENLMSRAEPSEASSDEVVEVVPEDAGAEECASPPTREPFPSWVWILLGVLGAVTLIGVLVLLLLVLVQ